MNHKDDKVNSSCQVQFFRPEEIFIRLEEQVEEISEIFQMSTDSAMLIYSFCIKKKKIYLKDRYNMSQLESHFLLEKEQLYKKFMINDQSTKQIHRIKKNIYCRSCCDQTEMISSLSCNHEFCLDCWKRFLKQNIAEQNTYILCMESGCHQPVTHTFIKHILTDQLEIQDYYICLGKRYIDENQSQNLLDIKWCPGVDCIYSVSHIVKKKNEVSCPNGHYWCYICRQEAHSPVTCNIVAAWNKIVNSQSDNVKWILENAKLCPFCHRPVEKNCLFFCQIIFNFFRRLQSNVMQTSRRMWEELLLCLQQTVGVEKFVNFIFIDLCIMTISTALFLMKFKLQMKKNYLDKFQKSTTNIIQISKNALSREQVFIQHKSHYEDVKKNFEGNLSKLREFLLSLMDISTNETLFITEEVEILLETWQKLKWTYALSHSVQQSQISQKNLAVLQHLQQETMKEGESLMNELKKVFQFVLSKATSFNKINLLQVQKNTKGSLVKLTHYLKTFYHEIEIGDFFSNDKKLAF